MKKKITIAVDFDGTLTQYHRYDGHHVIDKEILPMVELVRHWLQCNYRVVIFTSRLSREHSQANQDIARQAIHNWCVMTFGRTLELTADKSPAFDWIVDDRAVAVIRNDCRHFMGSNAFMELLPTLNNIRVDAQTINGISESDIPPKPTVPDLLESGAETFRTRNAVYKDNYKNIGKVLAGLFPRGISVSPGDEERFNILMLIVMCAGKLSRYTGCWSDLGHQDSAHDLMVYAAMMEEMTPPPMINGKNQATTTTH